MTDEKKHLPRLLLETAAYALLIPPTFIAWKLAELSIWWRYRRTR